MTLDQFENLPTSEVTILRWEEFCGLLEPFRRVGLDPVRINYVPQYLFLFEQDGMPEPSGDNFAPEDVEDLNEHPDIVRAITRRVWDSNTVPMSASIIRIRDVRTLMIELIDRGLIPYGNYLIRRPEDPRRPRRSYR